MVASKSEYLRLAARGVFGNRLREWPTLEALRGSDYGGRVTLRYRGGGARFVQYYVPLPEVDQWVEQWIKAGADPELIFANESAPDEHLVVQGELCRRPGGLVAFLSSEKLPMRKALERGENVQGLRALMILRGSLSPASFDDLMELLELYDEHTVEFSTFAVSVGDCPGRNTVIWEVRNF